MCRVRSGVVIHIFLLNASKQIQEKYASCCSVCHMGEGGNFSLLTLDLLVHGILGH